MRTIGISAKYGSRDFQAVNVPRLAAIREKPGSQLPEREVRFEFFQVMAAEVQLFFELLFDELRFPAIRGTRGLMVPDAIHPHVHPEHVAALEEADRWRTP